eukprot:Gb_05598 [translate_table: standard]
MTREIITIGYRTNEILSSHIKYLTSVEEGKARSPVKPLESPPYENLWEGCSNEDVSDDICFCQRLSFFKRVGKLSQFFELENGASTKKEILNNPQYGEVDDIVGLLELIKDHIERWVLNLKSFKIRITNKTNKMFNKGFVDYVENILGRVEDASKVQTLHFSAIMLDWEKKIASKLFKPDRKTIDLIENDKMKVGVSVKHIVSPFFHSLREQVNPDITHSLLTEGAFPVIVSIIDEVQNGKMRGHCFLTPYLEGLVGILARFTFLLDDVEVISLGKQYNLASFFTNLLQTNGLDEVQGFSIVALKNLSAQSKKLSEFTKVYNGGFFANFFICFHSPPKPTGLYPVHHGIFSSKDTFFLVEVREVTKLVTCLDH